MKLGDLAHAYVRGRVKRGEIVVDTARNHRSTLGHFAEVTDVDPAKLRKRHVEKWLESLEHLAPSTRRNRLATVRTFCRWLYDEGHCPRDAARDIPRLREPRRVPRALSAEQVADVLRACPDSRARLCCLLMVQEGLRRGEVTKLQVGDVDITNRMLRVVGKGGNQRVLWMTDETTWALVDYLAEHRLVAGPLIRSTQFPTQGLHRETVSRIVRTAMEDAGVKRAPRDGVSPHALRHSCATHMLLNGAHILDVQAVLGHADLSTSQRYMPLMVGTLESAMGGRRYGGGSQLESKDPVGSVPTGR